MNIAELFTETLEITFAFTNKRGVESTITIWVYEEFLTPSFLAKIKQFEQNQDFTALVEAFAEAIESWDICYRKPGEDLVEFLPTIENLVKLPLSFLTEAIKAIFATTNGDAKKPDESPNSSAALAKSES